MSRGGQFNSKSPTIKRIRTSLALPTICNSIRIQLLTILYHSPRSLRTLHYPFTRLHRHTSRRQSLRMALHPPRPARLPHHSHIPDTRRVWITRGQRSLPRRYLPRPHSLTAYISSPTPKLPLPDTEWEIRDESRDLSEY